MVRMDMHFLMNRKRLFKSLSLTAGFNTIIALFLTQIVFGHGLLTNFIYSQCIGLFICASVLAGYDRARKLSLIGQIMTLLASMAVGTTIGVFTGSLVAGIPFSTILQGRAVLFFKMLSMGLFFGAIITYFFLSRERISQSEQWIQEEKIKRLTLEKKTAEEHLRLLQAQIEPHFLFNTLSNILGLLETDREKGKSMLRDLTRYLRASLLRTRGERITLGQEMELIRSYVDIYKVRMGDRLRYHIEMPEHLESHPFPPLLVQPLVENAIKHGLEPSIKGGSVSIRVDETPESLRLIVADTGLGLSEDGPAGIGLASVRERIEALYGGKGRLVLEENEPTGLKVTIEIPHDGSESNYR